MTALEYLRKKGVRLYAHNRGYKCCCPIPGHNDTAPSLYLYTDTDTQNWYCFGENRGGDVYDLVMAVEEVGFGEAVRIVGVRPVPRPSKPRKPNQLVVRADSQSIFLSELTRVRRKLFEGELDFDEAQWQYRLVYEGSERIARALGSGDS